MGQLKRAIYARMEEVSFRTGVAVVGGVLVAAAAIALTVVLGGHGDAAASAPASPVAAAASASPSTVPAASSPSAASRPSDTTVPATIAGDDRPPTQTPARARPAAVTAPRLDRIPSRRPFSRRSMPRHRYLRGQPGWRGWHRPHAWWPEGL